MIVYSHSFLAMFTRFAMVIPGMESGKGELLAIEAERIVERWEGCLSSFRSGAELQIINALAHERELNISDPLLGVMAICSRYNELSAGLFDPAANESGSRWVDVKLDTEKQSIRFANPGVKIDMGGIGKGIALEEVATFLKLQGVEDAFLSFGESSIAGLGKHPHGDGWLVGSEEGFLLRNEFMSASGLLGSSQAHIFHPRKGELIHSTKRVLVKCDSPVEAEVLSTCGYMADDEEFEQLKRVFPGAEWRVE